jgi:tetratricopeptide (TPR) repeat protein
MADAVAARPTLGCNRAGMPGVDAAERALELADEAIARADVEGAVAHLSGAIRSFTAADEKRRAAMACARLGDTLANAMGNLTASRAWFARARRLVETEPPCVEQGWVAVAAMGCDVDDPAELQAAAELALDRARRFGDVNLETKALADAGLAHVQAGRVSEGMALLDEAMALACGPADDTPTAAKSVCSFFTACYFTADFDRARSWTDLLRRHGLISLAPGPTVFLSSHCDSVQATLLVELGRWTEAEGVLTRAKASFEAAMHTASWHPDIALADLRVRQGRMAEAEALLLGKDQAVEALLPAARLHLARGDHDLARAAALRGLRVIGDDRLRAVELLTVLVDAELARGDMGAATAASDDLSARTGGLNLPALHARAAAARARALAAAGDPAAAISELETAVDRLDAAQLPWLRAMLLLDLARLRDRSGGRAAATLDAQAAAAVLASLDVVLHPDDVSLLERLGGSPSIADAAAETAALARDGKWWVVSSGGSSVRLADTKGLRYLAELVARPGVERHALDLVDRVEGPASGAGPDRRALGDAGEVLDARARAAYRHRVEQLRAEADEALAAGRLDTAEAKQAELDQLVAQLAQAFGLGGRERRAASAAERARLNVTRALRAAAAKLVDAMPGAGEVLDRRIRTGLYCAYEPDPADQVRWIVQS